MNNYFKSITLSIFIAFAFSVRAQMKVGDNPTTLNASAVLEIESTNKGMLLPRVALTNTTISSPLSAHVAGMMVYNTATVGDVIPAVYFNDGTKWVKVKNEALSGSATETNVFSNIINTSLLGYNPTGSAADAPSTATNYAGTGKSISGKTCYPFTSGADFNNHIYCFFTLSAGATWGNHFDMAKQMGGYLATLTSAGERAFINSKLASYTNNIWLGNAVRLIPGNPKLFTWITGEEWTTNWSGVVGTGATVFNDPFDPGEPNNQFNNEGCVHIFNAAASASRKWNDINCLNIEYDNVKFDQLLVEFNK